MRRDLISSACAYNDINEATRVPQYVTDNDGATVHTIEDAECDASMWAHCLPRHSYPTAHSQATGNVDHQVSR